MKRTANILSAMALIAVALFAARTAAGQLWWERGADKWYYKDDWKGMGISGTRQGNNTPGVVKTIEVPGGAKSGWIVVWGGERGYTLYVNDKRVAINEDGALIDDFDLTDFVAGADAVKLRIVAQRTCAEGEIVGADGQRYSFATGADWADAGDGRMRATPMAVARSSGAYDRAHNGRLMTYNDEERGKTGIAKALARIQKLQEQGIYQMRRYRPAEEIVTFDAAAPWRQAGQLATQRIGWARRMLSERAIPAQKEGNFADAIRTAGYAASVISAAEAPVASATDIYRIERAITHLENLAALLGKDSPNVSVDLAELRTLARSARENFALGDWASANKSTRRRGELAQGIRSRIERAAEQAGRGLVGGAGNLDEYPEDQFAWLNAVKLTGNDPVNWPFVVAPSSSAFVDLAGQWSFRIDPDNIGEKNNWHTDAAAVNEWARIFAPLAWERSGYRQENAKAPNAPIGRGGTGGDKPYNGFAWYRKTVFVPAEWEGKQVVLMSGNIQNWSRLFVNGKPVSAVKKPEESRRIIPDSLIEIPAEMLKFGQPNILAIQVYNQDNFGGIVGGRLALYAEGDQPEFTMTTGPMSYAWEYAYPSETAGVRVSYFGSAMSPAVVVASDSPRLELWGWEGRGYAVPERAAIAVTALNELMWIDLSSLGKPMPGESLSENWILLRGGPTNALIVLERQPKSIGWAANAQGALTLTIDFGAGEARAALLCLPADAMSDLAVCRQWAAALRNYPVSASEIVRATDAKAGAPRDANVQSCAIRYNYLPLGADAAGSKPIAPVPMLASYGIKYKYPSLAAPGAITTGFTSEHAPYRFVPGGDTLEYSSPAVDRDKVMKGVGELFARTTVENNVHGGLGEVAMYERMAEWGFDHCRYAVAWQADWDMPLVKSMKGPIIEGNEDVWKRLDKLVSNCNDAEMQMMLTWFSDTGTRNWLRDPDYQKTAFELWRRLAERYADLPAWAISYDFFNEPAYMNTEHYNQMMKELTAVIRSVDKKHMIVWESGDGWAQCHWCLWMEPVADDNVLYSFHHYGKHWGYSYDEYYPGYMSTFERTQVNAWLEALLFGIQHHVPINCGEFGISMIQPDSDGETWLNDYLGFFERFGIGWNWWNYDGGNVYRTGLAAGPDRISPYVPIMTKWMNRSGWGEAYRRTGEWPRLYWPED